MRSIGVRELRQRASEFLRLVEHGESFQVTDRGRPVALLTPVPAQDGLERLRRLGELSPASADLDDLPDPLPRHAGQEAPSTVLARLRADER